MSSKEGKIPVRVITEVVGKWRKTYRWIPIFGALVTFAMAFFTGANNVPVPFSTLVGSGALTLIQATLAASVIYVPGTAFASNSTLDALFSDFLKEKQPNEGFLMWSLVAVLITATIWLALATYFEIPVSSQQSTQGALLGTVLVTEGISSLPTWNKNKNHNFNGGGLLWIFLEWTMAPIIACVGTFCFFGLLKVFILRHDKAEKRALLFVPICYGASTGLLCLFFMYQVIPLKVTIKKWETAVAVTLATLMGVLLSLLVLLYMARRRFDDQGKPHNSGDNKSSELGLIESTHDEESNMKSKNEDEKFEDALKEFMQLRVLDTVYEEDEKSWASPNTDIVSDPVPASSQVVLGQPTRFKQLLESTPNRLVQRKPLIKMEKTTSKEKLSEFLKELEKSSFYPLVEYDRHTLVRHALAEKFDETEKLFGFPQLLASCILAFIQSSTEIAAVVSPLGAIVDIFFHRAKFSGNGEDAVSVHVNWWIRGIGGVAASIGFFAWGWKLTQSLGGKLTYISSSRGMVSQLCTVATVIMMTRLNLPVSTSHAFVGSLLGIGIADDPWNVNWKLFIKFLFGWVFTILFCSGVAYGIYSFTIFSPGYVVP